MSAIVLQWIGPTEDPPIRAAVIGAKGATGDVTPEALAAAAAASASATAAAASAAQVRLVRRTANYTAVIGDQLLCDTTGGAFTVTLPASPAVNTTVRLVGNGWGTNSLTVARNGQTIEGVAGNVVLDFDADLTFSFLGGTWTRLPADRFENVSVLDYLSNSDAAAVVAGTADDTYASRITAAFQKALSSGRTWIEVPGGAYPINARLAVSSNQFIFATGKAILKPVAGSTANPLLFEVNTKTTVRFLRISFDGNRSGLSNFNNLNTNYQSTDVVYDGCYWFNTRGIACIFSGCNLSGIERYRTEDCGTLARTTLVNSDRKQAIAFTSGGEGNFVRFGHHTGTGLDSLSVTGQTNFAASGITVRDGDAGSLYFASNVGLTLDELDVQNGPTGGNGVDIIDCSDLVLGVLRTSYCGAAGVLIAGAIKGAAIGTLRSKCNWQSKGGASPSVHRGGLTFALLPDKLIENVSVGADCVIDDDQVGAAKTQRHAIGIYKQTPIGGEVAGSFKNVSIASGATLIGYDGSGNIDDSSVFQTVDLGAVEYPRTLNLADASSFVICPNTTRGQVEVVQINGGFAAAFALQNSASPIELYDPSSRWGNTDAGTDQVVWNNAVSGMIELKNRTGLTRSYLIRAGFKTIRT